MRFWEVRRQFASSTDVVERVKTANISSRTIARAIQDQLLKDFSACSEFSDWFAREEVPEAPRPPAIVKPNPLNIAHDEHIAALEERIKRYELTHLRR